MCTVPSNKYSFYIAFFSIKNQQLTFSQCPICSVSHVIFTLSQNVQYLSSFEVQLPHCTCPICVGQVLAQSCRDGASRVLGLLGTCCQGAIAVGHSFWVVRGADQSAATPTACCPSATPFPKNAQGHVGHLRSSRRCQGAWVAHRLPLLRLYLYISVSLDG